MVGESLSSSFFRNVELKGDPWVFRLKEEKFISLNQIPDDVFSLPF
jgi:hypothetical protein